MVTKFAGTQKFDPPMSRRLFTYLFIEASSCQTAVLDNEALLGILFNGAIEININVIALFVFYHSTKNLRRL